MSRQTIFLWISRSPEGVERSWNNPAMSKFDCIRLTWQTVATRPAMYRCNEVFLITNLHFLVKFQYQVSFCVSRYVTVNSRLIKRTKFIWHTGNTYKPPCYLAWRVPAPCTSRIHDPFSHYSRVLASRDAGNRRTGFETLRCSFVRRTCSIISISSKDMKIYMRATQITIISKLQIICKVRLWCVH